MSTDRTFAVDEADEQYELMVSAIAAAVPLEIRARQQDGSSAKDVIYEATMAAIAASPSAGSKKVRFEDAVVADAMGRLKPVGSLLIVVGLLA